MDITGKNNPNYKHGKWADKSYCECGRLKDGRSIRCSECSGRGYPRNKNYSIPDEAVIEAVAEFNSILEVSKSINVSRKRVTRIIKQYNLPTAHMRKCRDRRYTAEEILIKGSVRRNSIVKKIVIQNQLLEYTCSECPVGPEWNNKILTLELHHINGDPTDNRIENLTILCPNCHSQTDTDKGKNGRKEL